MKKDFYVYMLASKKNGIIYKGVTSNIIQRTWQHKNKIGSQFTKQHNVKKLVWYKQCGNWEDAIKWEKRLRRYPRQWKINLIEESNPSWDDLYNYIMDYTDKPCNDDVRNLNEFSKKLGSSLEARMIVRHYTGLADADLIGMDTLSLNNEQANQIESAITERLNGRPISKIIGYKEFYGRQFHVTDDVLDPRPDSETLIDCVLEYAKDKTDLSILDLGTGSGCLMITLLKELDNATGVATDISARALTIAQKNAKNHGVVKRLTVIESNWLESVTGQFDIIISNPPYIETRTVESLDDTVKKYDPIMALDGGDDGLVPYKIIFPQIRHNLKQGGFVAMEHGVGQATHIQRLIDITQFQEIRTHYDLAGRDRVISAIAK